MNTYPLTHAISQRILVLPRFPRISLRFVWVLGFIFTASLLIFYIFQVNEVTKGSFFVSSYEKKINELAQGNKNLEINFSQANSSANLETLLKNLNYEKVGKVYYISILESTVAAK